MELRVFPLPPLGANCYLLSQPGRTDALILDPGREPAPVADACEAAGLTPAAILLTHGHFDHVGGVAALLARWPGLPVYCHAADTRPQPSPEGWTPGETWRPLEEGQELELAGFSVGVLHTPGHTPGSVTFRIGQCLFTGDTLFRGSMGRTDLPGGDLPAILASLRRLGELPGDYRVYPGHDRDTTLARERADNPYLRRALTP